MNPHAGDCRRATALAVHYGTQNLEGVDAVLKEAMSVNRVTPLITSVLDLHESVVRRCSSPKTVWLASPR